MSLRMTPYAEKWNEQTVALKGQPNIAKGKRACERHPLQKVEKSQTIKHINNNQLNNNYHGNTICRSVENQDG